AALAPPKPPPTTTTRGAACARAGAATTVASEPAMTSRRLRRLMDRASLFLRGVPRGDGSDFLVAETLGDAIHHRGRNLAGPEASHLRDDLGRRPTGEPWHRALHRGARGMAATARRSAGGRLGRQGRE